MVWRFLPDGKRLVPKPQKRFRLRTDKTFAVNHAQAKEALALLVDLLNKRKRLNISVFGLRRSITQLGSMNVYLVFTSTERAKRLINQSLQNLADAGYDVEARLYED